MGSRGIWIAETNLRGVNVELQWRKERIPFVAQAETLDCVSLREPARADVLVAVGGDDVCFVWGEEERGQEGGMTQDERPSGRVLMRGEGVGFGGRRRRWGGCWKGRKRVAYRSVSRERSLGHSEPDRQT